MVPCGSGGTRKAPTNYRRIMLQLVVAPNFSPGFAPVRHPTGANYVGGARDGAAKLERAIDLL